MKLTPYPWVKLPIKTTPSVRDTEGLLGIVSNGFPLNLESSDVSVAEVKGIYLYIKKVGETIITIRTPEGIEKSIKVIVVDNKLKK